MAERLPQLKPKKLVRALERLGFIIRRQTGSHLILRHPKTRHIISVPIHAGDINRSLLFGILKQAEISKKQLLDALKK